MRNTVLLLLASSALALASCESGELADMTATENPASPENGVQTKTLEPNESLFAEADNSTALFNLDRSTGLSRCILKAAEDLGAGWDGTKASETEYREIAQAVDALVEGKENQLKKFYAIYQWITSNVNYDNKGENRMQSAYYTFAHKVANCQGYSNLMNTMCHAAGLACFNANGYMSAAMLGHAWNYVKADGVWYVVDSTNSRYWPMAQTSKYNTELFPNQIDVTLFEDEKYVYNWYGGALAVTEVKASDAPELTVPFSISGLRIFSFNPQKPLPAAIKEVYLSSNITTLGDEGNVGLTPNGKNVEAVHVSSANRVLSSYKGIVYRRRGQQVELMFIPPRMQYVELSPQMKTLSKNLIYNNNTIETLVIPASVTRIEPWCVEQAPNLHKIYIPEECVYLDYDANYNYVAYDEPTPNTFVGVAPDCEIIKGMPTTGIREVRR